MHKSAQIPVEVKYGSGRNVVEYIPIEFEIFGDGEYYKPMEAHNITIQQG